MTDKPKFPRRRWQRPEQMRAAALAAVGCSASEIAERIGGVTGANVLAMLREYGISPVPKRSHDAFILVRTKRPDRAALEATADARDRDPGELAALIVRKVLDQPALVDKLIDPLDVV